MPAIKNKPKRQLISESRISLKGQKRNCRRFFLDSGAHSLYSIHVIEKGHSEGYDWYKTKEFVKYVDRYARFCKRNKDSFDYIANVDVIFHPKMSWQVQKYLEEEHGLNPIPVIHFKTPLSWIDRYLNAGYKFLGIGGLGQEATRNAYTLWADRLFEFLCSSSDRLPCVRTHGFAMTSHKLMLRYPWWSVDSASWAKLAGFGSIYVPHKRDGEFTYKHAPYIIAFSHRSKFLKNDGRHFETLKPSEKQTVLDWLDHINVPFGTFGDGKTNEYGVASEYNARAVANLKFFEGLCDWLPKWPWPFKIQAKKGFFAWERIR